MRPPPLPLRRVVIIVPSLFTLFNLFFGIWAMVLATRGEFYRAGWFIVFAGILDTLDGRVARISGTGTRFGAELDSLVDIVSFGVAPAFLMYQVEFAAGAAGGGSGGASWIFCVTQAGRAKAYFIGLPSPAAGMTLATYYPFTQTPLYASLHGAPWHLTLTFLMIALTILMVSNVHYPTLPRAGFRTASGLLGLTLIVVILVFGIWKHDVFLFPLGIAYMFFGVGRAILLGFFKAPAEDEEAEIAGPIEIDESEQSYRGPRRPGTGGAA